MNWQGPCAESPGSETPGESGTQGSNCHRTLSKTESEALPLFWNWDVDDLVGERNCSALSNHGQLSCTTASTILFKNCTVSITGMSSTLSDWISRETYDWTAGASKKITATSTTPQELHLWQFHSFLHCLYQNLSLHERERQPKSKNCNCGISTVFCTTTLCIPVSVEQLE